MEFHLTGDQALVLFDWLSRLDEADRLPCEHEAETQVLMSLLGQLEKGLVEPFRPEYQRLVDAARVRLVAPT